MNTPHRNLDEAIDRVAARLVHVDDAAEMAARIVSALPERSRLGWWMPQLAALTAFAVAAIVWTMGSTPPAASPLPSSGAIGFTALASSALAHAPRTAAGTMPLEPLEPLEPVEPLELLEPLEPLESLAVSDLSPRALPAAAALTVPSIGVAELPLTAETFSQKEE